MSEVRENINPRAVLIDYTNWRGERSARLIFPSFIRFGESEYHPGPQWLLDAWDVEKRGGWTFAMKDIHSWGTGAREDGPESPPEASGEVISGETTSDGPGSPGGAPVPPQALGGLPGGTGGGGESSGPTGRDLSAIIDAVFEADRDGDDATLDGLVSLLTPADRDEVLAALVARCGVVARPWVRTVTDPGDLAAARAEAAKMTAELSELRQQTEANEDTITLLTGRLGEATAERDALCNSLARVVAERDRAIAEVVETRAFADSLMLELAEATGEGD